MEISTRNEALAAGLKRFYTGRLCKFGHDSQRFTTTGGCVKCNAERSKAFKNASHVATNARILGQFTYPCHAEDVDALLAYAQALDMARGRMPFTPPKPAAPRCQPSADEIQSMRAHALFKAAKEVGASS